MACSFRVRLLNPRLSGGTACGGVCALLEGGFSQRFTTREERGFFLAPAKITSRRSRRHCVTAQSSPTFHFGGRWTVDGKSCFWQRSAALPPRSGTGLAIGETGQAEPDWPAQQTGAFFMPPAKQPHFLTKSALRPGTILAPLRPMFYEGITFRRSCHCVRRGLRKDQQQGS